ncbi:MAG TPA: SGNH/GDSL hydrolase family protein, partial [Candidatus Polarisedimenticolia bacterium]|nr:SGNH/GDSL hydrolase family protein [Candidatus Polarisedimenticolia bacterium]
MRLPLRRVAGNLALLLISSAFACAAAEAYLRFFRPPPLEAAYVWEDRTLRHLPSFKYTYARSEFANIVTYNALGLRGPEVSERKAPGTLRVLFLGDSFVEGKQVADTDVVTAVLQRLAAAKGLALEVVNAGVSGYGTAEEVILWDKVGRGLHPDLVLVGFYPNDVRNNADRGLFRLESGRPVAAVEPPLPKVRWIYDIRRYFSSRSYLYMLLRQGVEELKRRGGEKPRGETQGLSEPLEAEDVFAREPSPKVKEGWELTAAL